MKRVVIIITFLAFLLVPTFSVAEEYEETDSYTIPVRAEGGGVARTLEIDYEGMVPCGRCLSTTDQYDEFLDSVNNCPDGTTFIPCTFCHGFMIFDRIIHFILGVLIPAIALIVIVSAGVYMITSAGNPEKVNKGKSTLTYAVLGLFLAYFSWAIITVIVSSFMDWDIDWGSQGIQVQHMCDLEIEETDLEVEED